MDARHRFGYAFLAVAVAQGIVALGTVVVGESTFAMVLDVLLTCFFAGVGVAYLTGRAGAHVDSRPGWVLRYGPPILVALAVVIAVLGLPTLLGA